MLKKLFMLLAVIVIWSFTTTETTPVNEPKTSQENVVCEYTIYKTNVTTAFWNELNTHGYEKYIIVKLGTSDTGVVTEPSDFLNQLEYLDLLNGICVEGYQDFVIIDEIDGA